MAAARVDGAEWMDAADLWRRTMAVMEGDRGFRLDFFAFAATVTEGMEKGTADGYRYALNAFAAYLGEDAIDVNAITRATVEGFRDWIERRNACGVPRDVVAEALNHASRGGERVTDIYLERDFSRVWDANRKVLDLVFGSCRKQFTEK